MDQYTAIEITNPKVAEILTTLNPTLLKLDYAEDLHLNFFVIGFPKPGEWAIVRPENLKGWIDHIEPGITIHLKQFVL